MIVYHMKYALTGDIETLIVKDELKYETLYELDRIDRWQSTISKKDCALTKEEANKRFEEMRTKKIKSLENKIQKLSKLKMKIDGVEYV